MASTAAVIIGVVFVALITQSTEAAKCYDCSSDVTSNCNDEFSSEGIGNCTAKYCYKLKGKMGDDKPTGVLRSCKEDSTHSGCKSITGEGGAKGTECYCDSDYCNAGPTISASRLTLSMAAVAALALAYNRLRP